MENKIVNATHLILFLEKQNQHYVVCYQKNHMKQNIHQNLKQFNLNLHHIILVLKVNLEQDQNLYVVKIIILTNIHHLEENKNHLEVNHKIK